ncbi:riboflavin synthase [Niabella insulamsoli]|uniref:riboflavin synthase n=1 Tax=Niabella insulamsoli TaxID=3144874 RepID=UPI0031FDB5DA
MFTGIIETTGVVKKVAASGSNKTFWIESAISAELKVDQSVSHNGVCLTVETLSENIHSVTAIEETLKKTNLGALAEGSLVNIERCLIMNGRLDGHLVQGHVDDTARCLSVAEKKGSWEYEFEIDEKFAPLIIEKGSACINGISLTLFDLSKTRFKVAIIPYTYNHTNIRFINASDLVNIEFDVVGKYILRKKELEC